VGIRDTGRFVISHSLFPIPRLFPIPYSLLPASICTPAPSVAPVFRDAGSVTFRPTAQCLAGFFPRNRLNMGHMSRFRSRPRANGPHLARQRDLLGTGIQTAPVTNIYASDSLGPCTDLQGPGQGEV
jgi:hypothetical protein